MDKAQMLSRIAESFGLANPPDERRLLKPGLDGVYEADEVKRAFARLDWQSVTPELLRKGQAAPSYFSDEAFVYYLPAYLKLIASDIEYADVLVDSILGKLVLPANEDVLKELAAFAKDKNRPQVLAEYDSNKLTTIDERLHDFMKTFARLTHEQSRCVLQFLEHLQEHYAGYFDDDILHRAIYRYWFIFANGNAPA